MPKLLRCYVCLVSAPYITPPVPMQWLFCNLVTVNSSKEGTAGLKLPTHTVKTSVIRFLVISAACWFSPVRLPSHIPSLTSSWFSVYHLVWLWLLTLLCTVAVKMQISQDSAFLFCRQFTVWRPHLPAAEQRTRVSAISILLSLGENATIFFYTNCSTPLTPQSSGGDQQAARSWVSNVWGPDIVCTSVVRV